MNTARISLIAACSENRVIGNKGSIPWHLKDDFRRFRERTTGHTLIMGRKTYDSIGRPLPNRTNIIISRDKALSIPGVVVVSSLDEALEVARTIENEEIFIGGGGQIYAEALPKASRLYLTKVHAIMEGDTLFPPYEDLFSKVIDEEDFEEEGHKLTYLTLERG